MTDALRKLAAKWREQADKSGIELGKVKYSSMNEAYIKGMDAACRLHSQELDSALTQEREAPVAWILKSAQQQQYYVTMNSDEYHDAIKLGWQITPLFASPPLSTGAAVPEGMVLVPKEPTEAMIKASAATLGMKEIEGAVSNAWIHGFQCKWVERDEEAPIVQAYKAMLAAAPLSAEEEKP